MPKTDWPQTPKQQAARHVGLAWRHAGPLRIIDPDKSDGAIIYRAAHVSRTVALANRRDPAAPAGANDLAYRRAFDRRKQWFDNHGAVWRRVTIDGRLFTGLGERGVYETQAALHPVTGLPRLPGSGLKGLLRAWCFHQHQLHAQADAAFAQALPLSALRRLFGHAPLPKADAARLPAGEAEDDSPMAGLLQIHDAWWDPDSDVGPLANEVDTPHHPDYYAGRAPYARDTDSPVPNPQLAIAGTLLLAIDSTHIGQEWATLCMEWLLAALAEEGAGARRTAGYGRMAPGALRLCLPVRSD